MALETPASRTKGRVNDAGTADEPRVGSFAHPAKRSSARSAAPRSEPDSLRATPR